MDQNIMIEKLIHFGLSRQEATIYLCLLEKGSLNGYEVAKETGISRSNVYSSLASLSDKGAANLIEGNPSKYIAVDADEFCSNYLKKLQECKDYLKENLHFETVTQEGYITISGTQNIYDKLIYMIEHAQERIYLSLSSESLRELHDELKKCSERSIKVVIISENDEKPDYHCEYYKSEAKAEQIRFIADSHYVLTGELHGNHQDSCLYCAQKNFVAVFKDALRNEIQLIKLREEK